MQSLKVARDVVNVSLPSTGKVEKASCWGLAEEGEGGGSACIVFNNRHALSFFLADLCNFATPSICVFIWLVQQTGKKSLFSKKIC
jgi:hypothetical protein